VGSAQRSVPRWRPRQSWCRRRWACRVSGARMNGALGRLRSAPAQTASVAATGVDPFWWTPPTYVVSVLAIPLMLVAAGGLIVTSPWVSTARYAGVVYDSSGQRSTSCPPDLAQRRRRRRRRGGPRAAGRDQGRDRPARRAAARRVDPQRDGRADARPLRGPLARLPAHGAARAGAQRAAPLRMRSDGKLSNEAMNRILRDLDLEESRLGICKSRPLRRSLASPHWDTLTDGAVRGPRGRPFRAWLRRAGDRHGAHRRRRLGMQHAPTSSTSSSSCCVVPVSPTNTQPDWCTAAAGSSSTRMAQGTAVAAGVVDRRAAPQVPTTAPALAQVAARTPRHAS
jgi:hypothetical protein